MQLRYENAKGRTTYYNKSIFLIFEKRKKAQIRDFLISLMVEIRIYRNRFHRYKT